MSKKHKLNLILNEFKQSNDPTVIPCTFVVLDYGVSHHNVIVEKDVALEGGKNLINKPIVAKYSEVSAANTATDNLGGHEQYLGKDRYGNDVVKTDTTPIGVFTSEGYETKIMIDGEEKEVMTADAILWYSRFPDACDLLLEWYNNGVTINTSCEYLYNNYSFQDGIEYHHSPIYFEGHAILASENRGSIDEVLPAYDSSKLLSFNEINKFTRLVAQAINQEKVEKERENVEFLKKVCELSHDDIRVHLYSQLETALGEREYSWISDVYETYFVVNQYKYNEEDGLEYDKYFKYEYSKNEEQVSVSLDSKAEVTIKRDWVEVTQVQEMQNSLEEKTTKLEELTQELNSVKETLETTKTEKDGLLEQVNSASEKLVQLNSQVEELAPFKVQIESEKLEKALNEKKEFYSAKFKALNAVEKFEAEEVQELVKKTVSDDEEGKNAIFQLNSMLIDMVELKKEVVTPEVPVIREVASKRDNLIPSSDNFDSRYSL